MKCMNSFLLTLLTHKIYKDDIFFKRVIHTHIYILHTHTNGKFNKTQKTVYVTLLVEKKRKRKWKKNIFPQENTFLYQIINNI